ncbi:MAG: class I SAM-dependent methyltransferase [Pseudonocardia sp.]|nr:class I SAM-dependent methyltransferase [Pseudonocardia sp.]
MTEPEHAPADEDLDRYRALLTPEGQAILGELRGRDVTGAEALRLGTELRRRYPAGLVVDALGQQELRQRAAAKFTRAADMFFTRAGWEQASAEVVARHRAPRFAGTSTLVELCCGIGGDLVALAADRHVLAVDLDPVHLWMAEQNARAYGVAENVRTLRADVRDAPLAGADAVFVDPARRTGRGRLRTGESEPPLDWCTALPVEKVGIKAAPGLPHDAVPAGWELEFVAVDRDLKEAVAWSPALATARARATLLPGGHTLVALDGDAVAVRAPGEYLLDPSPAVTRAGAVEELARRIGAWKIDDRIAFLSVDRPVDTPFARTLRVLDSRPWNQKKLPALLRSLDVGSVDIRRRGLAGDVDALHRTFKLSGSLRATLVMTRVDDAPWGFVCVEP